MWHVSLVERGKGGREKDSKRKNKTAEE